MNVHPAKLAVLLAIALSVPLRAATTKPADWESATPQSQGFDPARLAAFAHDQAGRGTTSLLILRHDRIVCEWYAPGYSRTRPHGTASLAKALVGGMSLMLAIDQDRIAPDDPACRYIPRWQDDPVRRTITIRQLATHTSGIEDAEEGRKPHDQLTGWKGDFWKRRPDPFSIAIAEAPVIFKPGTANAYSNPGMAALGYAITASQRGGEETNLRDLLARRLMDRIGVPENEWSIGYDRPSHVDGLELYATWGGASFSPRAVAAVARLLLRKGDWDGTRIIGTQTVEKCLAYAGMPWPRRSAGSPWPGAGLAWYTNFDRVWRSVPSDAFAGAGAQHQTLLVVPSLDLIVVRFGNALAKESPSLEFWGIEQKYVFDPLMLCITDQAELGVKAKP